MKTRLKITAIATFVVAGCVFGISRFQKTEGSALTLANVEALSKTEIYIEYDKCCTEDAALNCVPNHMGIIPGRPVKC